MKVLIFAFGKLKTPGMRAAADHYLKMVSKWAQVEEIELEPESALNQSESSKDKARQKEEKKLLDHLEKRKIPVDRLYVLDIRGTSDFTGNWGQRVIAWEELGADVAFAIGSSWGFSDRLKNLSQRVVGLGPHTMAHELTRVVLLEQLYRAHKILAREPYHY